MDPVGGVSGGYLVSIYAVAKPNGPGPYCVPNEYICGRLGLFVGLPVPPGGIVTIDSKPWYASMNFNLNGVSLPPVDIPECLRQLPRLSAGLLLFDILVMNADRHRGNFAVDFAETPQR